MPRSGGNQQVAEKDECRAERAEPEASGGAFADAFRKAGLTGRK